MALRGFSCPNCHTWFEGEGNHPKCPLCGTRASPRDLLDDREHRPLSDDYEVPVLREPPPREYEEAPDYEVAPDWDTPDENEEHHGWGDDGESYAEGRGEEPAYSSTRTQEGGGSDGDLWGRLGPFIGVGIFAAIIIGRICEAAG